MVHQLERAFDLVQRGLSVTSLRLHYGEPDPLRSADIFDERQVK
jgi:hypothetical protein